jgi:hypothetical protein
MSKSETSPTMIIPSGTEIQIDVHGQLSVRTPGNLVIQNSGHYGEIESVEGSIRIESNAEVEAVSVRCAETCYVQGSLTSWKVKAKAIHLEDKAQARIVLQETSSIEIGKNATMVGNFSSEKELFLLFSRFTQQFRSLPFFSDRGVSPPPQLEDAPPPERVVEELPPKPPEAAEPASPPESASTLTSRVMDAGGELPDQLFYSFAILQRESTNESYGATSRRALEELVSLLKARNLEVLQHTHRTLFGRIVEPGDDVRRSQELIETYFAESSTPGDEG